MELRGVLESSDVNEIRQKTDALQEASQKLAEVLYAQATAGAQSTAGNGGGSQTSDDEVVEDADFEVVDEEEGAAKS
jgi:molecular chaperone DnaK